MKTLNWYPKYMSIRLKNWITGLNWDWSIARQRKFGVPIPVWYDEDGKIYLPNESELPVDPIKDKPRRFPKGKKLIPETDVFDTWFTSSSSPELYRELVKNPSILLADEPTGNLDSESGNEIMKIIQNLNRETGLTVIIVTHETSIAKYTDRIISVLDGSIVSDIRQKAATVTT